MDLTGNIFDKIRQMLDRLQTHLEEGVEKLEANEIQAALDTARYQIRSYEEVDRLLQDEQNRIAYLDKLAVDLEIAFIYEEKTWEISRASDAEVAAAKADLAEKRAFYNQETDRRDGEIDTLDYIIDVFLTEISSMGDALRQRIDDYVHDERFDQGIFGSKTDEHVESTGNVAEEIAAAAGL